MADQDTQQDTNQIVPDGKRYRELKNGAIYDMEEKRICANPPGGTKNAITQATAGAMHELRREKARKAAVAGLTRVSGVNAYDSWSDIVEHRATIAATSKGRVGTEDAKFVGRAVGFLIDPRDKTQQSLQNHHETHPPGQVLRDLMDDIVIFRQQMEQNDE